MNSEFLILSRSPYNYTLNNPVRYVDPDGNGPLDWVKNLKTGEIRWFEGSGDESIKRANSYWNNGNLLVDKPSNKVSKKFKNLGDSYFGKTDGTAFDKIKINIKRKKYLKEVSNEINKKAGININNSGSNNIVFEKLKSKFMNASKNKPNKTNFKDEANLLWNYGGEEVVGKYLPKVLTKTIGLFIGSSELNSVPYRKKLRARAAEIYRNKAKKYLNYKNLIQISNNKY